MAPSFRELLGKLHELKRIAMRADKTEQRFETMINLAAAVINTR